MSRGRRKETRQQKFWVTTELLPEIPRHVFYEKLNEMLADGVFECLMSQRAIAWRCTNSLSLKSFLGYALCARTPDHSSLTRIRQRLPLEVYG